MKKITLLCLCLFMAFSVSGQLQQIQEINPVIQKIIDMGHDVSNIVELDHIYLVEGDLTFSKDINDYPKDIQSSRTHYRSKGLVSDDNITIKIFSHITSTANIPNATGWSLALQQAIDDWNTSRPGCFDLFDTTATLSEADIVISGPAQLTDGWPADHIFGWTDGNPHCGLPYKEVLINTGFMYIIDSQSVPPTQLQMRNIIGHELGHAIGFRHTDVDSGLGIALPISQIPDSNSLMHSDIVIRNSTVSGLTEYDDAAVEYLYGCNSIINDQNINNGEIRITDIDTDSFCDNGTFDVSGTFDNCTGGNNATIQLCFQEVGAIGTSNCSLTAMGNDFDNGTFSFNNLTANDIPNYNTNASYTVTARLIGANEDNSLSVELDLNCNTTSCDGYPLQVTQSNPYHAHQVAEPVSLFSDTENNLIVSVNNGEGMLGFSLLNNIVTSESKVTIKTTEEGCLLFAIDDTAVQLIDKIDDSFITLDYEHLYVNGQLNGAIKSLSKYDENGNAIWSIDKSNFTHSGGLSGYFYLNSDFCYLVGNNIYVVTSSAIYSINKNTGIINSSWLHGLNLSYSQIFFSNNSNHLYVINSQNGYISNNSRYTYSDIKKYQIGMSSLTLVSSNTTPTHTSVGNIPLNSGIWYNLSAFNKSNDRIFIFSPLARKIEIIDSNLNTLNTIDIPLNGFANNNMQQYNKSINFNSNTNKLIVSEHGAIYSLLDDNVNILSSVIDTNSLFQNNYIFRHIITQVSNNIVYSAEEIKVNLFDQPFLELSKLNPNTGESLNRVSNLIEETVSFEQDISIFPNPFDNQITIAQEKSNTIIKVVLLDKLGNTLLTSKSNNLSSVININTSKLSKGIYFIRMVYADGTSIVKQIIKE